MNLFRKDKGSTAVTPALPPRPGSQTASTPALPPRPGKEDVDNPVTHGMSGHQVEATAQEKNNEVALRSKRAGVMGVVHKVNPFKSTPQAGTGVAKPAASESVATVTDPTQVQMPRAEVHSVQNPGLLKGMMQKVNPFKASPQVMDSAAAEEEVGPVELQKKKPGLMMHKVNPFKFSQPKDPRPPADTHLPLPDQGGPADDINLPEKQNPGVFKGMIQKVNPFKSTPQASAGGGCQTDAASSPTTQGVDSDSSSSGSESVDDGAIQRHSIWYTDLDPSEEVGAAPEDQPGRRKTFRIKKILPRTWFGSRAPDSQAAPQEVEVQMLELAEIPVPGEGVDLDPLEDEDGLLSWWRTVEGWDEWNQASQDEEPQDMVEQAADRVFMAARLFVRFFNQRGASLQQRILELLALADSADSFHKKTVTASVGGGVASVAGSITTITGLVLAPFTAGTSLIVTAVGIGVATAGGVASASANITDTVHSKTDRKKVEKMIQDYEAEMKDIKDCLEFLQEGMETLEDWNFEQYAESISKKHLNQNVKHVMKEGGRAGKALVINTESLINTVQILGVAGGAAKAAQVMSVTTGVMSGLFLALDVFFLAKDSMELKKGAKTDFAAKIRDVCKELQDGLLELNRIKEQLQRTMDGIEVEEEEEEDEELLKSDLKKLIELEE